MIWFQQDDDVCVRALHYGMPLGFPDKPDDVKLVRCGGGRIAVRESSAVDAEVYLELHQVDVHVSVVAVLSHRV